MEEVIGSASVIGFTGNHDKHHGYNFNDIFHSTRLADGFREMTNTVRDASKSAELAVEKTAAAGVLAVEKTSAAQILALSLAESRIALAQADARAAAAECCCEIKELVRTEACTTRELINRIDSDNAKVALQNATAELLALKYHHDAKK